MSGDLFVLPSAGQPPAPAAPAGVCGWCHGRQHQSLKARIHCASGHAARRALYAWAEATTDVTREEVKALFGALHPAIGHANALAACEAVISAGWRPVDQGHDDEGQVSL